MHGPTCTIYLSLFFTIAFSPTRAQQIQCNNDIIEDVCLRADRGGASCVTDSGGAASFITRCEAMTRACTGDTMTITDDLCTDVCDRHLSLCVDTDDAPFDWFVCVDDEGEEGPHSYCDLLDDQCALGAENTPTLVSQFACGIPDWLEFSDEDCEGACSAHIEESGLCVLFPQNPNNPGVRVFRKVGNSCEHGLNLACPYTPPPARLYLDFFGDIEDALNEETCECPATCPEPAPEQTCASGFQVKSEDESVISVFSSRCQAVKFVCDQPDQINLPFWVDNLYCECLPECGDECDRLTGRCGGNAAGNACGGCPQETVCDDTTTTCVECTNDGHCDAGFGCSSSVCVELVECSEPCAFNTICDRSIGECVSGECAQDSDCTTGFICDDSNECAECQVNADCGFTGECVFGFCSDICGGCPRGTVCNPSTQQCSGGGSAGCSTNSDCIPQAPICHDTQCLQCTEDFHCAAGLFCSDGECVECEDEGDCDFDETCVASACIFDGTVGCDGSGDCDTGEVCLQNVCTPGSTGGGASDPVDEFDDNFEEFDEIDTSSPCVDLGGVRLRNLEDQQTTACSDIQGFQVFDEFCRQIFGCGETENIAEVDLFSSKDSCENTCGGECVLPNGGNGHTCGGVCVDFETNNEHCGRCFTPTLSSERCQFGERVLFGDANDFSECDENPSAACTVGDLFSFCAYNVDSGEQLQFDCADAAEAHKCANRDELWVISAGACDGEIDLDVECPASNCNPDNICPPRCPGYPEASCCAISTDNGCRPYWYSDGARVSCDGGFIDILWSIFAVGDRGENVFSQEAKLEIIELVADFFHTEPENVRIPPDSEQFIFVDLTDLPDSIVTIINSQNKKISVQGIEGNTVGGTRLGLEIREVPRNDGLRKYRQLVELGEIPISLSTSDEGDLIAATLEATLLDTAGGGDIVGLSIDVPGYLLQDAVVSNGVFLVSAINALDTDGPSIGRFTPAFISANIERDTGFVRTANPPTLARLVDVPGVNIVDDGELHGITIDRGTRTVVACYATDTDFGIIIIPLDNSNARRRVSFETPAIQSRNIVQCVDVIVVRGVTYATTGKGGVIIRVLNDVPSIFASGSLLEGDGFGSYGIDYEPTSNQLLVGMYQDNKIVRIPLGSPIPATLVDTAGGAKGLTLGPDNHLYAVSEDRDGHLVLKVFHSTNGWTSAVEINQFEIINFEDPHEVCENPVAPLISDGEVFVACTSDDNNLDGQFAIKRIVELQGNEDGVITTGDGACRQGLNECSGQCVNIQSHPRFCGGCIGSGGVACDAGQLCREGLCKNDENDDSFIVGECGDRQADICGQAPAGIQVCAANLNNNDQQQVFADYCTFLEEKCADNTNADWQFSHFGPCNNAGACGNLNSICGTNSANQPDQVCTVITPLQQTRDGMSLCGWLQQRCGTNLPTGITQDNWIFLGFGGCSADPTGQTLCAQPQRICPGDEDEGCVDISINPLHCGDCPDTCRENQACVDGTCVTGSIVGGIECRDRPNCLLETGERAAGAVVCGQPVGGQPRSFSSFCEFQVTRCTQPDRIWNFLGFGAQCTTPQSCPPVITCLPPASTTERVCGQNANTRSFRVYSSMCELQQDQAASCRTNNGVSLIQFVKFGRCPDDTNTPVSSVPGFPTCNTRIDGSLLDLIQFADHQFLDCTGRSFDIMLDILFETLLDKNGHLSPTVTLLLPTDESLEYTLAELEDDDELGDSFVWHHILRGTKPLNSQTQAYRTLRGDHLVDASTQQVDGATVLGGPFITTDGALIYIVDDSVFQVFEDDEEMRRRPSNVQFNVNMRIRVNQNSPLSQQQIDQLLGTLRSLFQVNTVSIVQQRVNGAVQHEHRVAVTLTNHHPTKMETQQTGLEVFVSATGVTQQVAQEVAEEIIFEEEVPQQLQSSGLNIVTIQGFAVEPRQCPPECNNLLNQAVCGYNSVEAVDTFASECDFRTRQCNDPQNGWDVLYFGNCRSGQTVDTSVSPQCDFQCIPENPVCAWNILSGTSAEFRTFASECHFEEFNCQLQADTQQDWLLIDEDGGCDLSLMPGQGETFDNNFGRLLCENAAGSDRCDCDGFCDWHGGETFDNCPDCQMEGCVGDQADGVCDRNQGESVTRCFEDCVATACNGNGVCEPELGEGVHSPCPEECPNTAICIQDGVCDRTGGESDFCTDCIVDRFCSEDDACASQENAEFCEIDCGCNNDGGCDPDFFENPENCPNDCLSERCNNDGVCHWGFGERVENCPSDCKCNFRDGCQRAQGENALVCADCNVDFQDRFFFTVDCSQTTSTCECGEGVTLNIATNTAQAFPVFGLSPSAFTVITCDRTGNTLTSLIQISVPYEDNFEQFRSDITSSTIPAALRTIGVVDVVHDEAFLEDTFEELQEEFGFDEDDITTFLGFASEDDITNNGFNGFRTVSTGGRKTPLYVPKRSTLFAKYNMVMQDIATRAEIENFHQQLRINQGQRNIPVDVKRLDRADTKLTLCAFSATLDAVLLEGVRTLKIVKFVEQVASVTKTITQTQAPTHLDRIDQVNLPLNREYIYRSTGAGPVVYVLDTGVNVAHNGFGGRARAGLSTVNTEDAGRDGNGHGTHVAGLVGSTLYGVAKGTQIVDVKVLGSDGQGSTSGIVEGINFVVAEKANQRSGSIINLSLSGAPSAATRAAIKRATDAGVHVVVAAGNTDVDACTTSPGDANKSAPSITVGAMDPNNDQEASFSNWGTCVDILAPGVSLVSLSSVNTDGTTVLSGTSMATPLVAGTVAKLLTTKPDLVNRPADAKAEILRLVRKTNLILKNRATPSPNRLLFSAVQQQSSTTNPLALNVNSNCGNGVLDAGETCDDRNANPGDGCSSTCATENGYTCNQQNGLSVCTLNCNCATNTFCFDTSANLCFAYTNGACGPNTKECQTCGDGTKGTTEACDDGNPTINDGCTNCNVDPGFSCTQSVGQRSTCSPVVVPNIQQVVGSTQPTSTSIAATVTTDNSGAIRCAAFLINTTPTTPTVQQVLTSPRVSPSTQCTAGTPCNVAISSLRAGTPYDVFCVAEGGTTVTPTVPPNANRIQQVTSATTVSDFRIAAVGPTSITSDLTTVHPTDLTCAAFLAQQGRTSAPTAQQVATAVLQSTQQCTTRTCSITIDSLAQDRSYNSWCLPANGANSAVFPTTANGITFVTNVECTQAPTVTNAAAFACALPLRPVSTCVLTCASGFQPSPAGATYTCNIDGSITLQAGAQCVTAQAVVTPTAPTTVIPTTPTTTPTTGGTGFIPTTFTGTPIVTTGNGDGGDDGNAALIGGILGGVGGLLLLCMLLAAAIAVFLTSRRGKDDYAYPEKNATYRQAPYADTNFRAGGV